jgi:hypothetical protein
MTAPDFTDSDTASDTVLLIRDIRTRAVLATLPWITLSYESRINSAGQMTATIPTMEGGMADLLLPGRVLVGVLRGAFPIWSGIMWKRQLNPSGSLTIGCEELLSYWDRRRIRGTLIFTQVDQGMILSTLVTLPQQDAYGNLGVGVVGNVATGVLRDRTYYAADRKSYGEMIRNLCGVIGAPDIKSDPQFANGVWTDQFRMAYPRLGRTQDQSHLTFIVGINCEIDYWQEDAASAATLIDCLATNPADSTNPLLSTYEAQFMYGAGWMRMEDALSFTDISVQATLNEKAAAEEAARAGVVLSITLHVPDADQDPLLGTYGVGDDARLIVPPGPVYTSGYDLMVRIASISVDAGQMDAVKIVMVPSLIDGTVIIPIGAGMSATANVEGFPAIASASAELAPGGESAPFDPASYPPEDGADPDSNRPAVIESPA